jgi:hypothetical protein
MAFEDDAVQREEEGGEHEAGDQEALLHASMVALTRPGVGTAYPTSGERATGESEWAGQA